MQASKHMLCWWWCRLSDTAVIIATDGLWDVTTEAEAVQIVHTALDSNAELKVGPSCQ